jgi:hypothetical protein
MHRRKQELFFKDFIIARLRSLEHRGFVASFLGSDGDVRRRITDKEFKQE